MSLRSSKRSTIAALTACLAAALVVAGLTLPAAPAFALPTSAGTSASGATSGGSASSLPPGGLGVDTEHLVLRVDDKGMVVTDAVRVINGTSAKAERLTFSIPEGYSELSFRSGLTDSQVDKGKDGFIIRDPLAPGKTLDVAFSYRLPATGHQGTLSRKIVYQTGNLSLVVQVDQLSLSGDGLAAGETVSLNGAVFKEYHRENIPAGTTLKVNWTLGASGSSATPASGTGATDATGTAKAAPTGFLGRLASGGALPIAIFMVGLVAVAYGAHAYLGSKSRGSGRVALSATGAGDDLLLRKSALIRDIAALDRRHQAGEVEDAAYEAERATVKAELVQVMLALRQAGKG